MRKLLIIQAFLLASLGQALADAPTVTDARTTVLGWFAGYEFVPTEAHFKQVGPLLGPALASIALDVDADLFARARAVSAMIHAPGPYTEPVLAAIAEAQAAESVLRRKAVEVLALNHGDTYVDLVASVFANAGDDLPLREACARALTSMPGEAARATRARLHSLEKSEIVRGLLAEPKALVAPLKATPVGDRFQRVQP